MGVVNVIDEFLAGISLREMGQEYLELYEEVRELEDQLKKQKQILDMKKAEIIAMLDSLSTTNIDLDGAKIIRSQRIFSKVTDFKALSDYIENELNEPLSEYGSFKFDSDKLRPLIDEAKLESIEKHIPLTDAMPKGLEMSSVDILTVRSK